MVSRSRWLVGSSSRSTSAGATSCCARPSRPRSPPLSPSERPGARLVGIEAEAVEHRVDARGEGVAALAVEALEVAVVARQHLRRAAVARLGERRRLLGQRLLEGEQLGERAGGGLPHRRRRRRSRGAAPCMRYRSPLARATVPAVGSVSPVMQAEERRLAGAVPADDAPPLAPRHGEGDVAQQPGGAELDGDAGRRRAGSPAGPVAPGRLGVTDGELLLMADERACAAAAAPPQASRASAHRSGGRRRARDRRSGATRGRSAPRTPNFCAKRRSSPGEAARSCRSTKWVLMRRSAKKRSALRVSVLFRMPKIWTSMGRESKPAGTEAGYTSRESPTARRPVPSCTTFWPNHTLPSQRR